MISVVLRSVTLFLLVVSAAGSISAQQFNSIQGFIFGPDRRPVDRASVELLDDYGRYVKRVSTDSSGRYSFGNLPSGRFSVRVTASQYGYQEQVQETEIVNFSRQTSTGVSVGGSQSVQLNFNMGERRTDSTERKKGSQVLFAQEIPAEADKLYKQAVADLDGKRVDVGTRGLEQALAVFPNYYYALERLGQTYLAAGRYSDAVPIGRKAAEVNPKSFQSWYILGYALYGMKNYAEATKAMTTAVGVDGAAYEGRFLLGVLHRQNGQFAEAEKELKKAKDLAKPPVADIHWQLALLYNYNLKKYKLAADELELYLKAKPDRKDDETIKKLIQQLRQKADG